MTSSAHQAVCDSCGKTYAVPDPDKTYACKHCDGVVRATPSAEVACSSCGAAMVAEDLFCAACGEPCGKPLENSNSQAAPRNSQSVNMTAVKPIPTTRTVSRAKVPRTGGRQRVERKQASHELVRANKFLKALRAFYILGAVLHAIVTFFVAIGFGLDVLDLGFLTLMLAIETGVTAKLVVGAIQLRFRPFFWAVLLAGLVTISRVLHIVQKDFSPIAIVFGVLWCGLFWALVVPTARIRTLLEQHPDLQISQHILGTRVRGKSMKSASEHAQLRKEAESKAWKRSLIAVALIFAFSVASAWAFYSEMRTPAFAGEWAKFEKNWQAGDTVQVAEWFPVRKQAEEAERLHAIAENRGWGREWPAPTDIEIRDIYASGSASIAVSVDANLGEDSATWTWGAYDGDWRLLRFEIEDPPFETQPQAWGDAWNASDYDRLAEFFENKERWKRNFNNLAKRKEWTTLPKVSETWGEVKSDGVRYGYFQSDAGIGRVTWILLNDQWVAKTLKPPSR